MALDAPALENQATGTGRPLLMATTIFQICARLGVQLPNRDGAIGRVSAVSQADALSLVFAADDATLALALCSQAGLILATKSAPDDRVIVVRQPRSAFALIYRDYFEPAEEPGIHPTAIIDATAEVGAHTKVGPGCVLESGVRVGSDCFLGPRVTVHAGTLLGNRVRVQAGAVLGSTGFGYVREEKGYLRFPQIGTLVIGDDVEIGANTTIDRGALGETRIGRGTKIDNLVHIAHNCNIGERVLIAAQVGLAGSITIEDDAMLGGQAGLGEHVTIGRGVILGGQGGVLPGKTLSGPGVVYWGTPAQPVREYLRNLARSRKG